MQNILNLKYPVIGLSPMDGVSDNAFRYITKKYSNPDLIFTEFTNVMGLCIAGQNLLKAFYYDESQRPIIGQIYGKEPEYFYHASKIISALGFDGVDINMGCPAKTVTAHGSGAGLIRTPELAKEIIVAVKNGVSDWVNDGKLTGLSEKSFQAVSELITKKKQEAETWQIKEDNESLNGRNNLIGERKLIPVSVKTRIGYDKPITETWIKNLTKANPAWITVHGRTLKQMYTGNADWEEIKIAVSSTNLPVIANGDINSLDDLKRVLEQTNAYGALIGRATFGNPWIFNDLKKIRGEGQTSEISQKERFNVLIEHAKKFIEDNPDPKAFFQMRKHFGWYVKGFDGAKELREKLMKVSSLEELKSILNIS